MKHWLSPPKGAACLCAHCGSVGHRKADRRGISTGSIAFPIIALTMVERVIRRTG